MFTGIIETLGTLSQLQKEGSNVHFTIKSDISKELKIDQSVAHNGVCLTVIACDTEQHTVTAIDETLQKTNLGQWQIGSKLNLERCMPANGRFDGHIVQGHVDETAICQSIAEQNGSWVFQFANNAKNRHLLVNKGSICINGISLTVVEANATYFSVAIIPYTYEHTMLHTLAVGDSVNLEYDIVGKYIANMMRI